MPERHLNNVQKLIPTLQRTQWMSITKKNRLCFVIK